MIEKLEIARTLASSVGDDYVEYKMRWRDFDIFFSGDKRLLGSYYGYPSFILVNEMGKARFAKFPGEVEEILAVLSRNNNVDESDEK